MEERYTILGELGSGGFGSVYKAHDGMLDRDVALKRLDSELCAEELRTQLMREARILAAMQHPNIVSIYDISSGKDYDEIVMELLDGVSLDRLVKRHLLHGSDLRNVAGQILKALEASHEAGVLHCDLKPENIMLCLSAGDHYEAKVYDFGLSKSEDENEAGDAGKMVGSIYVMAPELFNGEEPTVQSDLYALGCILYYLLVGQYPFVGDGSVQVMASHMMGNHQPLSVYRGDLSPELCLWVESLIRTDVNERTSSAKEALIGLRAVDLSEAPAEETFTLPTALELGGNSSRLVRKISLESLDSGDGFHPGDHTTVVLNNTFDETSKVEVRPELPGVVRKPAPQAFVLSDTVAVPDDAEWFFTIKDDAKGPVNLEQLKKLCLRGRVVKDTLVWHSYFVDWVTAGECAETAGFFREKKRLAAEAVAEIEREQGFGEEAVEEKKEVKFGVALAVAVGIALLVVGGAGVYFLVDWREAGLVADGMVEEMQERVRGDEEERQAKGAGKDVRTEVSDDGMVGEAASDFAARVAEDGGSEAEMDGVVVGERKMLAKESKMLAKESKEVVGQNGMVGGRGRGGGLADALRRRQLEAAGK